MVLGLLEKLRSWVFIISLATLGEETTRVGVWPSLRSMRGPYLLEREAKDWCGKVPNW